MSKVHIEGLTKRFKSDDRVVAIDDLTLEIDEGELLVLLGPSGCGKTTTLRCLAGLEEADTGTIRIGEKVVFDSAHRINVPPWRRRIGLVFQSYALWPHMTVEQNISYPLRVQRHKEGLRSGWVKEAATVVECQDLLKRYPSQLSGGQQQRVALARGLVARPGVLLFDEPLSNLDARLRGQVRSEIHAIHRRLGFTGVYVTHDQSEALALASRIAVMRQGRVEQLASPDEIYGDPATEYVANFIGVSNRIPLEWVDGRWRSPLGPVNARSLGDGPERHLALRVWKQDISVIASDDLAAVISSEVRVSGGRVVDWSFGGRHFEVVLDFNGHSVHAQVPERPTWEPGDPVSISFSRDSAHSYGEDGRAVRLGARLDASPRSAIPATGGGEIYR